MKDIDFKLWIATVMVIVAVPLGYLIGSSRTSEWKTPVKSEHQLILQAERSQYLKKHMETCKHKAKSSTAGVTTKTE